MKVLASPPITVAAAVAVLLGPVAVPPDHVAAATRIEAISVQLQAAVVGTALDADLRGGSANPAAVDPASSVASATVDPVDVIAKAGTLIAAVAGAALWFVAFPVTLPASMLMGAWAAVAMSLLSGGGDTGIDKALTYGLGLFLTLPVQLVETAATDFGRSLGLIAQPIAPVPAAVARRPAAAAATSTTVAGVTRNAQHATPNALPRKAARATAGAHAASARTATGPAKHTATAHRSTGRGHATPR